jgi:YD repeat-containing protein
MRWSHDRYSCLRGNVLELGNAMEGGSGLPADCDLRAEVVRVLDVLHNLTDRAEKLTSAFADETYGRFKTLIDEQGALLQMFGLPFDPQAYPWNGPLRASVWRIMRMIKNPLTGGGALNRSQYLTDIRAMGTYYQKYRDLITSHGVIVTDGEAFTQPDYYVHWVYSFPPYVPHQLGYDQLRLKVVDRLLDLFPPAVANSVFSISQSGGLGNECPQEENEDKCIRLIGEDDEPPCELCAIFLAGDPGVCTYSNQGCSRHRDCTAANQPVRHEWGPSARVESRCPILDPDTCPPVTYDDNSQALMSLNDKERCVRYGVNTHPWMVAEPGAPQRELDSIFPAGTVFSSDPNRTVRVPRFAYVLQHEIGHAITHWMIRRDDSLKIRLFDQLIPQACDDELQYLHPNTFCGLCDPDRGIDRSECPGNLTPNPCCNDDPEEFFAGLAGIYLTDTETTFNLARARWMSGKVEPINQFLYVAGIFSMTGGSPTTFPFFYQDRFTNSDTYAPTAPFPRNRPHGLGQYQSASVSGTRDAQGRITTLNTPDGKLHTFGYAPLSASRNVVSWTVSPP